MNWIIWHEQMYIMLQLCEVQEYTQGQVERPNTIIDLQSVRNWSKNDNYAKHLLTLNISTTKMMNLRQPDFYISDAKFKVIISSSLPQSWGTFTEDYIGQRTDIVETNLKKLMTSQEFIGIICEEYRQRTRDEEELTNLAIHNFCPKPPKPNLMQHISNTSKKWCSHCKHKNHNNADCHFLNDTPPC